MPYSTPDHPTNTRDCPGAPCRNLIHSFDEVELPQILIHPIEPIPGPPNPIEPIPGPPNSTGPVPDPRTEQTITINGEVIYIPAHNSYARGSFDQDMARR